MRPESGVNHPPPSSAEVKERVELYLYSSSGLFKAGYRVNFTFTLRQSKRVAFTTHTHHIKQVLAKYSDF